MAIEVLYQDSELLLVNKPSGLLSVPGRGEDKRDCVLSRVQVRFPTARIVHRLDCATSGIMVLALNADCHRVLSRQFQERQTQKRYLARVFGTLREQEGEVNLPLRCDWENRPKQIVDHLQGKPSQTRWRVLAHEPGCTRLELLPITGRSHQLRVHMQALGHPILGDGFYAHPAALEMAERLQLHAEQLGFTHPGTGTWLAGVAPCPF